MDPAEPYEPTPLHNVTSGTGCGCGCLGALIALVGAVALAGIPLEVYEGGPGSVGLWAGLGLATGIGVSVTGLAVWVLSLFID